MKSDFLENTVKLQEQIVENQKQMKILQEENERLAKLDKKDKLESGKGNRNSKGKDKGKVKTRDLELRHEEKIKDLISRASLSELTIYKNAVENQINKSERTSSEDEAKDTTC